MSTASTSSHVADIVAVHLQLASPADIRSWSAGEVTRPELFDFRTHEPIASGLFCDQIFHSDSGLSGNFGHIELIAPVVHPCFLRRWPVVPALLGLRPATTTRLAWCAVDVVLDPGDTPLRRGQILDHRELAQVTKEFGNRIRLGTGGAAIRELLQGIDLEKLTQRAQRLGQPRRLAVIEALQRSGNRPEWLILECIPVVPPAIRPLVRLPDGNLANHDLNDLYRQLITRNNRLKKLLQLNAPPVIVRDETRHLQRCVENLFDNICSAQPLRNSENTPLKSLTAMLEGRLGRHQRNLLSKRVDYSARAVVVPNPRLRLNQCALPREIALVWFERQVLHWLCELGYAPSRTLAQEMVRRREAVVWDVLEEEVRGRTVILVRQPVIHRGRLQAFEITLTPDRAIHLHPVAWLDFGLHGCGEHVIAHLPLSTEAQVEAELLLLPGANTRGTLRNEGRFLPRREAVLGCHWLTREPASGSVPGERLFASVAEVELALAAGKISLHERIQLALPGRRGVVTETRREGRTILASLARTAGHRISTTAGRALFNDIIDPSMDYYDCAFTHAHLKQLSADCIQRLGATAGVQLRERLTRLGLWAMTRSGLLLGLDDLTPPVAQQAMMAETTAQVEKTFRNEERGVICPTERLCKVFELWTGTQDRILEAVAQQWRERGSLFWWCVQSGAGWFLHQLRPLVSLVGFVTRRKRGLLDAVITSNYSLGLPTLSYWQTTLRPRHTGMRRRLRRILQLLRCLLAAVGDVVVTTPDCGTKHGLVKQGRWPGYELEKSLIELVRGRATMQGEVLVDPGPGSHSEKSVEVRSPLTCSAPRGLCALCWGADPTTGQLPEVGTPVGVRAALDLAGTALLLRQRRFVASCPIDYSSLAGVLRLLSGRTAEWPAFLSEVAGQVLDVQRHRGRSTVTIQPNADTPTRHYQLPRGDQPCVAAGDEVQPGQRLSVGEPAARDLLRILGPEAAANQLVQALSEQFLSQNRHLDERNLELLVRWMLQGDELHSIRQAPRLRAGFLAAAIGRVAARVLLEAALAGRVDGLSGLQENVMLGRLIPAGTGYRPQ